MIAAPDSYVGNSPTWQTSGQLSLTKAVFRQIIQVLDFLSIQNLSNAVHCLRIFQFLLPFIVLIYQFEKSNFKF